MPAWARGLSGSLVGWLSGLLCATLVGHSMLEGSGQCIQVEPRLAELCKIVPLDDPEFMVMVLPWCIASWGIVVSQAALIHTPKETLAAAGVRDHFLWFIINTCTAMLILCICAEWWRRRFS